MQLGVEPASGVPNRLIFSRSGAAGMLMDFMVGAVVEHGPGLMAADHVLFQKTEGSGEGEAVEELKYNPPFSKFGREDPSSRTVEHHIPKSI